MRHRSDSNQPELKAAFERLGCSVVNLSQVGNGCPDLAVSLHGFTVFVEIKTADGKLRPEQLRFHRETKAIVHTIRTIEEAVQIVAALKAKMRAQL